MIKFIDHPLIKDKLTRMRKIETQSTKFRDNLTELTQLMAYEVTRDFEVNLIEIDTPICKAKGYKLKNHINIIPILRAGLGMSDALKSLIPTASVGHIGIYRDEETLEAKTYYCKMPKNINQSIALVLDPMLATGSSAIAAIDILKNDYKPLKIIFICLVASPEGVKKLSEKHPDIDIYGASLDEKLDKNGYIVPGLGDAGDRIFGTK
ncbi:MAG: uracil phosphoribosyltransferase [Mycoplasmoidaceae bacterium]